jgi:hypothetical protein
MNQELIVSTLLEKSELDANNTATFPLRAGRVGAAHGNGMTIIKSLLHISLGMKQSLTAGMRW